VTAPPMTVSGWSSGAAAPHALPACSLIIPTYRRPVEIVRLLALIADLPDPPGEVVVVDGSPEDEGSERAAHWAAGTSLPFALSYVRSPTGLTRQRNVGIDVSTGALVFFLDDDCFPEPGYFQAIERVYASDVTNSVGGVCGALVNEMDRRLSLRWRLRLALHLVPKSVQPGRYYQTATSVPMALAKPFTGTRSVDIMTGAACSFRRDVLSAERFSSFFYGYSQGEDLEMSMRVRRFWQIIWCGDARAYHAHAPGGRPPGFAKARMEAFNRVFIWRRHTPTPSTAIRVRFWLDMAFGFGFEMASWIARPWHLVSLSRALGVARGTFAALWSPPNDHEPPARCEYVASFTPLDLQPIVRNA